MIRVLNITLMLVLSAFAFGIAYVDADSAQRDGMKNLPAVSGEPFVMPEDPRLNNPETAYGALLSAAVDAKVNIIRTNAGYGQDDRFELTQYVLLTGDTRLHEAFQLTAGRWPVRQETQHGRAFVSTSRSADPDRVGTLGDFAGNDHVEIRPLATAYETLPVSGRYIAESSRQDALDRFFALLAERSGSSLKPADFRKAVGAVGGVGANAGTALRLMLYFIVLLTAMLLVYGLLHDAKRVGVMKLNGVGTIRIWYEVVGRAVLMTMAVAAVAAVAAAWLTPASTLSFVGSVLGAFVRAYLVMLIASLLTCLYITRIRLAETVKNRKDTKGVFVLNSLLKTGCAVIIVLIGTWAWSQYSQITGRLSELGNWEKTSGYATFTPTSVGGDLTAYENAQPGPTSAEVHDLYPLLNRMGSLYVDASSFEPLALKQSQGDILPPTLQVNPNFLRVYPVRDVSGRNVEIPETTTDWVVLVPDALRSTERDLLDRIERQRKSAMASEPSCSGRPAPAAAVGQQVRIIWLSNNQRVFSFNPNVYPDANNEIPDPVMQVLTEANSFGCDRANMITGAIGGAMKVRLVNADPKATLESLRPTLARMQLDDNLKYLITMNDYILQRAQELREAAWLAVLVGIGLVVVLLVLAAESLVLAFTMFARKIVVRRLHGVAVVRAYREYLQILGLTWLVHLFLALLLLVGLQLAGVFPSPTGLPASILAATAIAVFIVGVEMLSSGVVVGLVERRSLVKTLKGEF